MWRTLGWATADIYCTCTATDFRKKGMAVDARLAHMAIGIEIGLGRMGTSKM